MITHEARILRMPALTSIWKHLDSSSQSDIKAIVHLACFRSVDTHAAFSRTSKDFRCETQEPQQWLRSDLLHRCYINLKKKTRLDED